MDKHPLKLQVGSIIRHLKRGSIYEVMGYAHDNAMDIKDGRTVTRFIKGYDVALPVAQQRSGKLHPGLCLTVYYRALVSSPGEPWLFQRPINEFTPDRFELVVEAGATA